MHRVEGHASVTKIMPVMATLTCIFLLLETCWEGEWVGVEAAGDEMVIPGRYGVSCCCVGDKQGEGG